MLLSCRPGLLGAATARDCPHLLRPALVVLQTRRAVLRSRDGQQHITQASAITSSQKEQAAKDISFCVPEDSCSTTDAAQSACNDVMQRTSLESNAWRQWQSLFEQVDIAAEEEADLQVDLREAIKGEHYGAAAAAQARLITLATGNAVSRLQSRLSEALASEQYATAAALRDEGLASLQGWWLGRGEDDPEGHLLHIRPEYGRWTGRVFKPDDIAAVKGWKESVLLKLERLEQRQAKVFGELLNQQPGGDTILEVFMREEADGSLSHQAVSFAAPQEGGSAGAALAAATSSAAPWALPPAVAAVAPAPALSPLSADSFVRLAMSIAADGTTTIVALPGTPVQSRFDARGSAEAAETMRQLQGDTAPALGTQPKDMAMDAVARLLGGSTGLPGSMPISDEDDGEVYTPRAESRSVVFKFPPGRDGKPSPGNDDGSAMRRVPCELAMIGRDQFVLRVPEDPASREHRLVRRSAARRAVRGSGSGDEPGAASPSSSSSHTVPPVSTGQYVQVDIPMGRLMMAQLPSAAAKAGKDMWDEVADRVASLQERKGGRTVPKEALAAAIRTIAQRLSAGEAVTEPIELTGALSPAAAAAAVAAAAAKASGASSSAEIGQIPKRSQGTAAGMVEIGYSRLPPNAARTDPFAGLYLGAFGPHGPELLTISRGMLDGEEVVLAHKLTGDENVPAGALSFRAKIARKYKLDSRDVYPEELGVIARYKGEGRVASAGHKDAKSVEGELLVFSGRTNITGAAQLGFVWAIPNERRFLILLNRVDLREFEGAPSGPRIPCASVLC